MGLDAVPYMIVSRDLLTPGGVQRVFVCMCLIDHLVLGVGATRDEALDAMTAELQARHGDHGDHDNDEPCLN
jgi:hypothetical protein